LEFSPFIQSIIRGTDKTVKIGNKGEFQWRFQKLTDSNIPNDYDQQTSIIVIPEERYDLFWLAKGGIALERGDQEGAIQAWRNIPQVSEYLIGISMSTRNSQASIKLLRLSSALQATGLGYHELGVSLLESGEEKDAIEVFEQAALLAEHEKNKHLLARIYLEMGDIYLHQRKNELALIYYQKAIYIKGDLLPGEMVMLARAHIMLEHYGEAEEILNNLIRENPNTSRAWWWLGEMERIRGNTAKAIEAYQEFKILKPDHETVDQRLELLGVK
jgi:tetratricopeptide (TPR) repeat protein